ncbi:uncharacterized protein [Spinacia oleracea]|uniref:Uncharacterized protein n=1 Tax=Spinacia oleracea TaxID=3562 RepID=A0ABM3QXV4_SPIOL|nr:uncharacterized protein LOC130463160 [Spinacia oleracea]
MEGKLFSKNKNILAILFIVALVQIMADKAIGCGVTNEKCDFLRVCCSGYVCDKTQHQCVQSKHSMCQRIGERCGTLNLKGDCCGKSYCKGSFWGAAFGGTCTLP